MKKISCIVPAYNEELRIRKVLEVVESSSFVDEIIIVDDGSKDSTKLVIENFLKSSKKTQFIIHPVNMGKSMALYDGIMKAGGDYVFFLDSDLIGLNTNDIDNLIKPIIENLADVSISLRKNSPSFWHWIGVDYISGERVLPKSLILSNIEEIPFLKPFGFESWLNHLIIKKGLRIKIVNWSEVESPIKIKKMGLLKGIKSDFFMMADIFQTIGFFGPLYQIWKFKKLMI